MVLALEAEYDGSDFWYYGRLWAVDGGQEVQPLFTMKDVWDVCACEAHVRVPPKSWGQLDEWGEEITEYVWCPVEKKSPLYRYDWRVGRELTEEQATRWALHHGPTAHHLFPTPAKEDSSGVITRSGYTTVAAIQEATGNNIFTADYTDDIRSIEDAISIVVYGRPGGGADRSGPTAEGTAPGGRV